MEGLIERPSCSVCVFLQVCVGTQVCPVAVILGLKMSSLRWRLQVGKMLCMCELYVLIQCPGVERGRELFSEMSFSDCITS